MDVTQQIEFIYRTEIDGQIKGAFWAIEQIEQNPMDVVIVFSAIQSLLTSCANISKFFTPPSKGDAVDRLQNIFQIFLLTPDQFRSKFPLLSDRTVRDSSDHFDERIDYFTKEGIAQGKSYGGRNIGTICLEANQSGGFYCEDTIFMKHYDPEKKTILYVKQKSFEQASIAIESLKKELLALEEVVSVRW